VRYHFGDDPSGGARWADPSFDDTAWPVAINGRVAVPAYYSDGFVWVRLHTVAPVDVDGPLALRQVHPESTPGAEGNSFGVAPDEDSWGPAAKSLGVTSLPALYILDRSSRVRIIHLGYDSSEQLSKSLSRRIDELL
jgi:hypothetical protein